MVAPAILHPSAIATAGNVSADISVLNNSDGSASWCDHKEGDSTTGTTVVTSVNGPVEVRLRDEILGEATLELKVLPASGLAGTRERYIESTVRSAVRPCLLLGLHPRSLVQITSQIVSSSSQQGEGEVDDDGSQLLETISAVINSVVLACVDAGISMRCMLAAAVVSSPEKFGGSHVACYSFPQRELIMLESQGPFQRQQLDVILQSLLERCVVIHESMRAKVEEKVLRDNRWKGET